MKISIVIPVFNSERSLEELYLRLKEVLTRIDEQFEIIMVDDGSTDQSFTVMRRLRALDERVKIIRLSGNSGQHNATLCGFKYCRGDYIITLDDDLQNPPEEIPVLLGAMQEGFDVVFGIPGQKQHSYYRNWGSRLIDRCMGLIFPESAHIKRSSFRILSRPLVDKILDSAKAPLYMAALILLNASKPGNALVGHESRKYGKSNYSLKSTINMTKTLLVYYSFLPLKIVRILWQFSFVVAIILILVNLLDVLTTGMQSVINYIFISLFAVSSLISLWLLGEYLKRFRVEENPVKHPYSISEMEL